MRFQFSGPPQKRGFGCACVLCLPRLSGSGSQELGRPLPRCGAPFPSAASGPGSQRLGRPSPGAARPLPPRRAAWAARGLTPSPRARRAFSLRGPSARRRWGLRKSSTRNRGLSAGWEGLASLGLSLHLSPPPASFLQRGWASSSLEFLSPFVLRTAGGVFWRLNFSSLSHSLKKSSLRLLSGPSGRSLP